MVRRVVRREVTFNPEKQSKPPYCSGFPRVVKRVVRRVVTFKPPKTIKITILR